MTSATSPVGARHQPRRSDAGLIGLGSSVVYASLFAILYRELVGTDSLLDIGSYNLTTAEPVLGLLIVSIARGVALGRFRWNYLSIGATLLSVSVLIALARGILVDPFPSLFASRTLLSIPLFCLFGSLMASETELTRRAVLAIKSVATILAMVVFLRLATGFPPGAALQVDGRPLWNYGALLIAFGTMMCVSDAIRRRGRFQGALGGILLLACLLSGQGTANVANLVGTGFILVRESGRDVRERWVLATLALVLILTALTAWPMMAEHLEQNRAAADYLAARSGTNMTRQIVWQAFLADFPRWPAADQLFGLPLGQQRRLFIDQWGGTFWKNSLHSMYFQTLYNLGAFGLASYLLILFGSAAIVLLRMPPGSARADLRPISPVTAVAFVLAIAVFSYSYDLRSEASLMLMLVVSATLSLGPRRSQRRDLQPRVRRVANRSHYPAGSR